MKSENDLSFEWSGKIGTLMVCIILAAAVFAAFEGVRKNDFVNYDDDAYVTNNTFVQGGLNAKSIAWAFTTWHMGNWHPLTWISHMIDCSVFGPNPAGHHLVSVGFHIANVVLLFLISKKMSGAFWASAFMAALFGLHPLGVESVAWVAERKNVLSTFFAFLTIAAYFRYTRKPRLWRYFMVVVLFASGLLSKPMLVTLPFVLVLLDYWPISRFGELRGWGWLWRSVVEKLPLIAMSAVFCAVTYIAQTKAGTLSNAVLVPLGLRVCNALVSYIEYIGKVFYPASLAALYPLDLNGPAKWRVAGSIMLLLAATAVVIVERRKRGFLLTGWFWYLGTLVPVIGLVQVGSQAMADRYMYLPGIGIYIIVVWLAREMAAKVRLLKVIPAAVSAVVLVLLLLVTRVQVGHWKDSESLCRQSLAVTKDNFIMHNNYGELLGSSGRLDSAIEHFRWALEINPRCVAARENLGTALQEKGLDAEAAAEFEAVLRVRPNSVKTHNSYGVALAKIGQYDKAIEQFSQVLAADPYSLSDLNNIYKVGVDSGKLDKALEVIVGLQAKAPDNFELYVKAGLIYGTRGNVNAAIEQLETACRLTDYSAAEPLDFLSQAYAAKKNMERAIEAAQMALNAATEQGKSELAGQIKGRLELYKRSGQVEK